MDPAQKTLENLFASPAIIVGYVAGIVLSLGLAANRSYLVYLGINPAAVDSSGATLTFTYLSFGIKVLIDHTLIIGIAAILLLGWIYIPVAIKSHETRAGNA